MLFVLPKYDPLRIVDEEFLNTASLGRRILTGVIFLGRMNENVRRSRMDVSLRSNLE